jgi:hypothetical protein
LPLRDDEIEALIKKGDESLAVAMYARSLKLRAWDFKAHPGFKEFVGGLLCISRPDLPKPWFSDEFDYDTRFRAYPLAGLWSTGIWGWPVH